MGITDISVKRINQHLKPDSNILILGCQNLYSMDNYGEIAHEYYAAKGHNVLSLDILGCQGSVVADLREDLGFEPEFDQIWNHGTYEHCDGSLYWPFRNAHNACKSGGIMIHENPLTGNWPLHGQHYFTQKFFSQLAKACGYDVLELGEEASMGNDVDGWNVFSVLRKGNEPFVSETEFNKIYKNGVFAK